MWCAGGWLQYSARAYHVELKFRGCTRSHGVYGPISLEQNAIWELDDNHVGSDHRVCWILYMYTHWVYPCLFVTFALSICLFQPFKTVVVHKFEIPT
jgi:hypothetical protein